MSQSGKRDAQQAFGTEAAKQKNESPTKKNRRRRSEKASRLENGSAQDLSLRSPAQDASKVKDGKGTPKEKTQKQEALDLEQQSTKSPKSTQTERKQSSPQPEAKPQTHVDDQESPQGKKKRQRSKRNHQPKFDQNTSQIELVLAHAGELSSVDEGNEAPASSKKKGMSDNRHRQKESEKHSPSKKHRREKPLARKSRSPHDWTLSRPAGGAFIGHDPVLTPDQQFLILATKQNVEVYSTKTSLLVRTIHVTKRAVIVSYIQIHSQAQYLAVGLSDGSLSKYDWTTGKRIWTIGFNGSITAITSTSSSTTEEAFLMINNNDDGTYHMTSLTVDQNGKQTGRRSLLTQKSLIKPQICFSAELGVVVVSSKDAIMVGKLGDESGKEAVSVKWCDISTIGGKIVCFDAQILPSRKQSKKASVEPTVNIAVGLKSGEIHIYGDVLNNTNVGQGSDLHVRRLHWHRAAPRTVKFSPDSNYLISGGDETVLVIWQLDTNQKQVLPHLTSSILNATVATQGSAYALRLADNSIMVLSTSDLQPFANVSNLAVDASSRAPFLSGITAPAALHPNHTDRLLLAYSLQNGNFSTKPAEKSSNMIQTYDIAAQLQLGRQALARNLASTVNIGPSGQPLTEPDVTHLDISHDGKWLVTVDQWSPSNDDLDKLYLSRGDQSHRVQLNECFLRFWSTNNLSSDSGTDLWELNTRIDEPISTDISLKKRAILAIAVSPVRPQVVIADSNRHLKIFSPKARIRSGVPVRGANGQQLFTWTCDHEMSLQEASQGPEPEFATLAFSEDGSVLAASWSSNSYLKARVHLVEPKAATKVASLPDIVTHGHAQLAFCGRYLIGLSEKFCVFDMVTMQKTFSIEIDKKFDHGKSRMAANIKSGIVAVAVSERVTRSPSHLILFDVRAGYGKTPLLEEVVHSQVHILLAEKDRGGFLIIDGEGRTIKLSPPGSASQSLVVREELPEKKIVRSSLDNVFGTSQKKAAPAVKQDADEPQRASLGDVFRFESSAQAPPAKDLFNQVALVVAGAAA